MNTKRMRNSETPVIRQLLQLRIIWSPSHAHHALGAFWNKLPPAIAQKQHAGNFVTMSLKIAIFLRDYQIIFRDNIHKERYLTYCQTCYYVPTNISPAKYACNSIWCYAHWSLKKTRWYTIESRFYNLHDRPLQAQPRMGSNQHRSVLLKLIGRSSRMHDLPQTGKKPSIDFFTRCSSLMIPNRSCGLDKHNSYLQQLQS